ncbi:hypothetical protein Tco_0659303 [Tanacetum coccineum]
MCIKHFKSVSVKPKTQYQPKAKQSTVGTTSSAGTNKVSNKESPSNIEEGQCYVSLVERIIVIEKQIHEDKLLLVDDDEKPLENVDYPANADNDDEVEPVENETASFFASKGIGYGPKSL